MKVVPRKKTLLEFCAPIPSSAAALLRLGFHSLLRWKHCSQDKSLLLDLWGCGFLLGAGEGLQEHLHVSEM